MSKEEILTKPNAGWTKNLQTENIGANIAISTRVRLARNLAKRPFPHLLKDDEAAVLAADIEKSLISPEGASENQQAAADFTAFDLADLKEVGRQILFEKHFVSLDILKKVEGRKLIVNNQQSLAIMINEEDHLRMQCILPGLQLDEAWRQIDALDDTLGMTLDFAFDEKLGFLTACPTNVGTGLRASVMLHLSGLVMTNKLEAIFDQLPTLGLTVRGVYGEGSKSYGHLYQISNQISLGFSENEIIRRLNNVVQEIIAQERQAREWLWQNSKARLADFIYRGYGILKNARLISNQEAMEQISAMRFGVYLGLIKEVDNGKLNEMMISCQPAFLTLANGKKLPVEERDWARAKVIRSYFGN